MKMSLSQVAKNITQKSKATALWKTEIFESLHFSRYLVLSPFKQMNGLSKPEERLWKYTLGFKKKFILLFIFLSNHMKVFQMN
jgi:hypothetical protein